MATLDHDCNTLINSGQFIKLGLTQANSEQFNSGQFDFLFAKHMLVKKNLNFKSKKNL